MVCVDAPDGVELAKTVLVDVAVLEISPSVACACKVAAMIVAACSSTDSGCWVAGRLHARIANTRLIPARDLNFELMLTLMGGRI